MKALKKYISKRAFNLKGLLKSLKYSDDLEIIHQIRIEIKKLKSIINFLHFEDSSFQGHKTFIPLRTIFRKAGKIREPIELQKKLSQYTTDIEATKDVQKPSLKFIKHFKNKIPDFISAVKKTEKNVLKRAEKINKKALNKYLSKQQVKIERQLSPVLNPSTLHLTRKRMKEVMYLSSIGENKENLSPFFSESADMIGQWHDKQIIIQILNKNEATNKETVRNLLLSSDLDLQNLHRIATEYYTLQLLSS